MLTIHPFVKGWNHSRFGFTSKLRSVVCFFLVERDASTHQAKRQDCRRCASFPSAFSSVLDEMELLPRWESVLWRNYVLCTSASTPCTFQGFHVLLACFLAVPVVLDSPNIVCSTHRSLTGRRSPVASSIPTRSDRSAHLGNKRAPYRWWTKLSLGSCELLALTVSPSVKALHVGNPQ